MRKLRHKPEQIIRKLRQAEVLSGQGKTIRLLTVIDKHSRKCLAIRINYHLNSDDVLDVLSDLFLKHGI